MCKMVKSLKFDGFLAPGGWNKSVGVITVTSHLYIVVPPMRYITSAEILTAVDPLASLQVH